MKWVASHNLENRFIEFLDLQNIGVAIKIFSLGIIGVEIFLFFINIFNPSHTAQWATGCSRKDTLGNLGNKINPLSHSNVAKNLVPTKG